MVDVSNPEVEKTAKLNADNKRKKLVRKKKGPNPLKYKAWFFGHVSCIVFGSISFMFQIFWLPNKFYINSICYRISLFGAMISLMATVSHKFGFDYLPPSSSLLAQQNFQFLLLAVAWLMTFKSIFKLLPYYLISVLQLGSHKNIDAIQKQEDVLASLIAYDELFLIGYLLLRTIFFRGSSGFQLVLYGIFYWLRILFNKETSNLFMVIISRLDGKVKSKVKHEKFLYYWNKTRMILEEKHNDEQD